MGYYPDIPVDITGYSLREIQRGKEHGHLKYVAIYERQESISGVTVEVAISAHILGLIARAVPEVFYPTKEQQDTSEPLMEDKAAEEDEKAAEEDGTKQAPPDDEPPVEEEDVSETP